MLEALLSERSYLLADGATGTNYFNMGLVSGDAPELWNLDYPDRVKKLHKDFVDAGADIILTNSFGGSSYRLKLHNAQHRVHEINVAAARNAREIADDAGRSVIVAGSIGPTGEIFEPVGDLRQEDGKTAFAEQAKALKEGGADVLWLETLSSREEFEAAVAGASDAGLPIVSTLSFDTNGSTMMGITPLNLADMVEAVDPNPAAYGTNCGVGPAEVVAAINEIRVKKPGRVLVAKANCGVPEFKDGAVRYDGTPDLMAQYACMARDAGAKIIGGCCGTTPNHLARMSSALMETPVGKPPELEEIVARLGEVSDGARSRCLIDFQEDAGITARRERRHKRRRS